MHKLEAEPAQVNDLLLQKSKKYKIGKTDGEAKVKAKDRKMK